MKQWYYADNRQQKGPIPESQLIDLFKSNQIAQDTPVWAQGMAAWTPINQTELAQASSSAAPQQTNSDQDSDIQWFYSSNGKQLGPVSENEVLLLLEKGSISADNPVWTKGMPNWAPANQTKLASKISQKATSPAQASQSSNQQQSQRPIAAAQSVATSHSQPAQTSNLNDSYLNCEQFDAEKLQQSIFLRPISVTKLVVYSICSMGFYLLYWFYKNFQRSEGNGSGCVVPFVGAMFSGFTVFILTHKVSKEAEKKNLTLAMTPHLWGIIYFIMLSIGGKIGLFMIYSFIPLIFLQQDINKLNEGIEEPDSSFSLLSIFICIPGALVHLLVIYGALMALAK